MTTLVDGPGWSATGSRTFAGRFPLSVERHTMNAVDALVPGATTVTANAQYYALHAHVAAHASSHGLTLTAAQALLRRVEVAMCGISALHLTTTGSGHPEWLPQPHGFNVVWGRYRRDNVVDVRALAAPQVYAQPWWGFLAAYRGSEMRLKILARANEFALGERVDADRVAAGLTGLIALAQVDDLTEARLKAHEDLCLCRLAERSDGAWLAERFAARNETGHYDATRRSTLRMLDRCMALDVVSRPTVDVTRILCFDPHTYEDPVLGSLPVVPQWRGLMLRNYSVRAWRDLWAWMVNGIDGLSPRQSVGHRLAEQFDASQTVRGFRRSLPATRTQSGSPAAAELDDLLAAQPTAPRLLGLLALGAQRANELTGDELHGFQGHNVDDIHEELAPAWLSSRLDDWADRPMPDFTRWLADVMINRSQRLALAKARPNAKDGIMKIPTRIHLRDGFIFKDSPESGGPASLRLDQLASICGGMGLFDRSQGRWARGPRGDLLDDG